jgi:hypothetical protein
MSSVMTARTGLFGYVKYGWESTFKGGATTKIRFLVVGNVLHPLRGMRTQKRYMSLARGRQNILRLKRLREVQVSTSSYPILGCLGP